MENRIQPWRKNQYFWQFHGKPIILIGGSSDDNQFQDPTIGEELDLLVEVGGNYIRNTMSDRDPGNLRAFEQAGNGENANPEHRGKYDLDRWNEAYFDRLEQFLTLTSQRGIIVQIEIWDQWDHNVERWSESPWNPENNINYTIENTNLKGNKGYENVTYNSGEKHDFFLTIPTANDDKLVLKYQKEFVRRILLVTLNFDNVLYNVTNELFYQHPAEWGVFWASFIKEVADESGRELEVTEMFQYQDITHAQHRNVTDHPEIYDYIDLSQNSTTSNQAHWDQFQIVRERISERPRPLNHTKTYGGDEVDWTKGDENGIERFWRNIIGGAASCRFHRPPAGVGLNPKAQAQIRSMRMVLDEVDLTQCQPDVHSELLSERENDEAYLTSIPGEAYVVYFPAEGKVGLDMSRELEDFTLRWLDISNSSFSDPIVVDSPGIIELITPESGSWVAIVQSQ